MKIIRFSQKGLVGCWRFDEETGSTAKDSSPYGNDGTIYGATRVRGIIGKALQFDGVDDYVVVPDDESLDITDEITAEAWIYPMSPGQAWAWDRATNFASKSYASGWSRIVWQLQWRDDKTVRFLVGTEHAENPPGDLIYVTSQPLNLNNWYHVVGTYNRLTGKLRIYINSVLHEEKTYVKQSINQNDEPIDIGRGRTADGDGYFNGLIDEVRIYNKALSPGEIKIIYAFTKYIKPHPIIMRRKL